MLRSLSKPLPSSFAARNGGKHAAPSRKLRSVLACALRSRSVESAASFGRWWFDTETSQIVLSARAAQLLEVEAGLHRNLENCLIQVIPDDVLMLMSMLPQAQEKPVNCEFRIVNELSGLRWIHMQSLPRSASQGGVQMGVLTDITASKHAALRERFSFESTQILIGTSNLKTAVIKVIELVCENLGWEWGAFWAVDPEPGASPQLACRYFWHAPHFQLTAFTRESGMVRMAAGEGLVGQVWSTGQAGWVEDIENNSTFLRRKSASECGLLSGYAFPVAYMSADGQRRCPGVLEFFSTLARQREAQLPNLSMAIGTLIAQTDERLKQHEHILQLARIDALTGLANHGQFHALLEAACSHAALSGQALAVLYIDLDRFKTINDRFGHAAGNQVLCEFARRLLELVPEGAEAGRLGGDEFAILCPFTTATEALKLAERILATTQLSFRFDEHDLSMSASIGVGFFPGDGQTGRELLRNADAAMYRSKQNGRNALSVWSGATARAQAIEPLSNAPRKQRLAGMMESIDEVLWTFAFPGWAVNYVSPAVERIYGHARYAFYADPHLWLKSVHPADRAHVVALSKSLVEGGTKSFQYRIVRPDKEVRWIRYEAYFVAGAVPGTGRIESVGIDISGQHRMEESLRRCHRALRVIHDCEQVIAGSSDERSLLQGVCDVVAVGYRMAWVGVLSDDGSGRLILAGITGAHQDYLDCLSPSLAAGVFGKGTIGKALRSRSPVVVNDLESDARLAPLWEDAVQRGFRAKIALPLYQHEEALGILNVYSVEHDAFDPEEVALLQGLADRVTATIQTYRHRAARHVAEAALRLRERALEASANAIMISSARAPHYAIEYVNPAFERMTGYAREEVIGRNPDFLLGDDRAQHGVKEILAAFREKREGNTMLRNYRKDGTLYWNDLYIAPVKDEDKEVRHFVVIQYDVTVIKRSEAKLQYQAHYDALTGLPNRVLLNERLGQAIADLSGPVWLVYLDLDRFKVVNDSLGHQAGDVLLKHVAERLRAAVKPSDTVARLGGDEYVMILSDPGTGATIAGVVQGILDAVAQPLIIEGHEFFPTCSMGIAAYPADGKDEATLMRHADIAMYRAKELGRNNYQFYSCAMNAKTLERLHLEGELRHALERDEFVLHYQPQVDLQSGQIVGMEALIRWNHPELGMVPPDRFIGLAEETGLIVAIGAWVLRTACAQNKVWQRSGFAGLRVAVNLSARQFGSKDLANSIIAVLEETGLAADGLEIELTESSLMADVDGAVASMRALKAIGIHLSLDDFGTGYSSLSYLKRFPIDVLKIDQSFVRDVMSDPDDAAIVASIISLAHNLKLHVIAEGVETAEQLAYLRLHGCDDMQGYYFSKPVPAAAFEQMLREGKNLASVGDAAAAPMAGRNYSAATRLAG